MMSTGNDDLGQPWGRTPCLHRFHRLIRPLSTMTFWRIPSVPRSNPSVPRRWRWTLGVLALSMVPAPVAAQKPYACTWTSEVTPLAVIRFDRLVGMGSYEGRLLFNGEPIGPFSESTSQGYATNHWSMDQGGDGTVLHLRGNRLVRSLLNPSPKELAQEPPQVILVGLGRHLWYRGDQRWRDQPELLAAAEGVWRVGPGCRRGP